MEALGIIPATVTFIPLPWAKVSISDGSVRCLEYEDLRLDEKGKLSVENPTEKNPHFWEEVRQLYFTIKDKHWSDLRSFYQKYGPISDTGTGEESLERCAKRLNWFRGLTILAGHAKAGRTAPLWEMFGPPRELRPDQEHVIYLVGNEMGPAIRWSPWPTFRRGKAKATWLSPQNDDELLRATWVAVTGAVTDMLRNVMLVPVQSDTHDLHAPLVLWGFLAQGALQAAFLQWFIKEMGHIDFPTCAAQGCRNVVLPPRQKFCSEKCRQREKKRRQRKRIAEEVGADV